MPEEEQNIKHSFSETYGRRLGPQDSKQDEAGYLGIRKILAEDAIRRQYEKEARERRRKVRMARKRNNRYYARKKARLAAMGLGGSTGKHPLLTRTELAAVEEAAGLA